jgi:hypothetical protein
MRRWLVLLLCAIPVLALGVWPGSSRGIVCPAGLRAMTAPCCGPPTNTADASPPCCATACCAPGCCASVCCGAGDPQPACPVAQLTISSSRNPSIEGQEVTISGELTNGSTQAIVYLWQRLVGQSSFTRIAQTTSNAAGDYAFVRSAGVVQTNASWYTSTTGATSPTLLQSVSAKVTFVTWVFAGTLVKLKGHVSPSHRGERILLQWDTTAKRWHTVASSVIGRLSRFTVRHRFAHDGNVLLRAVFGGDARNTRSTSAPLRIFVH